MPEANFEELKRLETAVDQAHLVRNMSENALATAIHERQAELARLEAILDQLLGNARDAARTPEQQVKP